MNKTLYFFLSSILFLTTNLSAAGNKEFRGIWVVTWEHINSGLDAEQNKANIRTILDNVKKANMNAVLWQVRQSGTAYYNSSYEPWGKYAGYRNPGYDPLAYAIEQAHQRGIELHAWFNVFNVSDTVSGTIAKEHPDWICTNEDGEFMSKYRSASPGLQAVREYTVNVAMEIVRNYDIDGFHLDYIRWNEYDDDDMKKSVSIQDEIAKMDGMISEEKWDRLYKGTAGKRFIYDVEHPASAGVPAGFDSWDDWRRWSVTEFVRVLHDSIQAVKPWVRLSPAALGRYNWGGWNGYYVVFQDAALWFNEGYIDQLTPMHYHWTTGNEFYGMLKGNCPSCWQQWIQPGIDAKRLYTVGPGSYILDENNIWYRHEEIVNRSRDVGWVGGFQFFSYNSWKKHEYWETAANTFFSERAKIPVSANAMGTVPDNPTIALNKVDSLTYEITVTPPTGLTSKQWMAVYRSQDAQADTSSDEVLEMTFGDSAVTVTDRFNGLQDYNGQYHYFATVMNRYRQESAPSNIEASDPIPSFAPTITETYPAQGEEIPVNDQLIITFSKTIDTSTVSGAVHIVPDAGEININWDSDLKKMTIGFSTYLQFETEYALKLDSVISDVNGRMLDGNNDGVEGDSYVLNFRTLPEDFVPPFVTGSYPPADSLYEDFDVTGTMSIWFNEELNDSTITPEKVVLTTDEQVVETKYLHHVINNRSVITVQAKDELKQITDYRLTIDSTITDTIGNAMGDVFVLDFHTTRLRNKEEQMIDDFSVPAGWWQPTGSGSTVGIDGTVTKWGYTKNVYLPAPNFHKAAYLQYKWKWDNSNPGYLIREYLPPTDNKNTEFDTTYVLQVYLFGDSSLNTFRFCIDEYIGSSWTDHEVSKWITIDWYGWKLVEWKLSDPNSVGSWISSNEELTGSKFRIDSFQFGHEDSVGAVSGKLYFDNFRLVKKTSELVGIEEEGGNIPLTYQLKQNYPNPFNPITSIEYQLAEAGQVFLTVYNILGERVTELVKEYQPAGRYKVFFDGSRLASGTYIYRLQVNGTVLNKKMLLLK
ncbi:MAG TPA: T9SS type A sorting domain-containing protein [Caldithrix abyssi]|uniref:T9SS type A sorting domain-containing protein n=1 Tax=Caldithrix abyssi TaxID=187145 RepID=A0A7V4WVJ6_CALAY|nr:T9SS type A sorting domain-containing protein [Caldithrix abyssi]